MHHRRWKCAVLVSSCLLLPGAVGMPLQSSAGVARVTKIATASADHKPSACFDRVFYGPLPGKTNYCLGLRDWENGHYRNGLEFLKLAAGWGNKNAQYTLGMIYYNGHHVPADHALGLAWLKLANQRHNDSKIALATRSAIKWATRAQRQRALQLYHQMLAKYGDKVATARAWHHLQHWRRSHNANNRGCMVLVGPEAHAAMASGLAEMIYDSQTHKFEVCMHLQTRRHVLRHTVHHYFQNWAGTVTVGPLQQVPAPASSVH